MLALAALAASAAAQDSVSLANGLPGDAVDSRAGTEQINDYVVDLTAFESSSGKTFAVGPIAKSSQQRNVSPLFFTGLVNAQALSRRVAVGVPFLRSQYAVWNAAGLGVNGDPTRNAAPGTISTVGFSGYQAGFAFAEFSDGDPSGTSLAAVTSGLVNFTDARPSRLYVSRITAATNGATDACSSGSFGMGAVDEDGNVHFRADNFGGIDPCGGLSSFQGNNLFRVRAASRAAALNVLSGSFPVGADVGATEHLLAGSATVHNVPNAVPNSAAGRPLLIGSNFAVQYVFEQVAGSVVAGGAAAHLAGNADHRGAVGYTSYAFPSLFPAAPNGTAAIIAGASGSGGLRDRLAIWGVAADGSALSPLSRALPAPAAGLDPDQPGWVPTAPQEFDHYHSQTAFQGGSAQVALGRDQGGNLVAAGVVYYGFVPPAQTISPFDNPQNYLAVARTDALTGTTTWRAAAWTTATSGKNIYQNGTTVIGNLRPFGSGRGPCFSGPMIDSVGNVWFLGSFERSANPGSVSVGLFRSIWQPATSSYRVELVLAQGDVIRGANSARDYLIGFFTLNDADSISSGTAWSSNIAEVAHRGISTVGLATDDARTLGGIVISASIVYDNDQDGQFIRSTGTSGTPGSPDEDYNVLLYVAASADCDGDGIPDDRELAEGTATDTNGNGIPDSCEGLVGTLFCFGDGSGTACPCGNSSSPADQVGCLSSLVLGGKLRAGGNPSLSADTIVLTGTQMPNSSALYFQGTSQLAGGLGSVFGDGLRCAGGSIIRLGTKANTGGGSQYPVGADQPVAQRGLVTVPGVRTYQIWYRNAAAFCTVSTFNLSNGVELTWTL
jgi:hypothetical protein